MADAAQLSAEDTDRLRILLQEVADDLSRWLSAQKFGDCQMQGAVVSHLAAALLLGEIKHVGFSS
jgi:succinate dehydrogenase flavin-adding protein (antitoxin of CptAB toxin-antitoxin module)